MSKLIGKINLLTQAVLASSLFSAPFAYATPFGPGSTTGPVDSSVQVDNLIEVLGGTNATAGQIIANNAVATVINSINGRVVVDANNATYGINAILVTGTTTKTLAVNVDIINDGATVTIEAGSGINNINTYTLSPPVAILNTNNKNAVIDNFGTISVQGGNFDARAITTANTVLTNYQGGYISGGGNGAANGAGATIFLQTGGSTVINAGRVDALNTGSAVAINATSVNIINQGTIFASAPAVASNSATISTFNVGNAILTNSGTITNGTFNESAIDFTTSSGFGTVNQIGGLIAGNVLLPFVDDTGITTNTFNMSGGIIDGNVIENNTNTNVFTMNGGTINGLVQLGNSGNAVNFSGGTILQLVGGGNGASNDIFNLSGGTIIKLTAGASASTLNINDNFTSTIIKSVEVLNVNNIGTTFTVDGPITGLTGISTIDENTNMIVNAPVTGGGIIANNGLLQINSTWVSGAVTNTGILEIGLMGQLIATTFTEGPGSYYAPILYPLNNYGQILVTASGTAANLTVGSFVAPQLVVGQFYVANSRFDIISAKNATGMITDNSVLVQPASVILGLRKTILGAAGAPQTFSITVNRNAYSSQSSSSQTQDVALTLDSLASGTGPSNNSLLSVLGNLDFDTTQAQLQDDMASLTPPANYSLVQTSHVEMDEILKMLTVRMGDLRILNDNGSNYGDPIPHDVSFWGSILGAYLNQQEREGVYGYHAHAGGLVMGADWAFNECTLIGLTVSYAKAMVDGKGYAPKDQSINSWQATGYGWYEPTREIFIDFLLGVAKQHFNTNRVITANALVTAAQGSFNGTLYGVMSDIGYALVNNEAYYFAPFMRLKYSYLDLQAYTESGAAGLNLAVSGQDLNEFSGGVGLRLASSTVYQDMKFVPEISGIFSYDFVVDAEQTTSNFLGGGIAFATNGITPGKAIFDFNLSLNTYFKAFSMVTVQYNVELREQYVANSGFVKYYYLWS